MQTYARSRHNHRSIPGVLALGSVQLRFEALSFGATAEPTSYGSLVRHSVRVPLDSIVAVEQTRVRFLRFVPMPTRLVRVTTASGAQHEFAVHPPEEWQRAISSAAGLEV